MVKNIQSCKDCQHESLCKWIPEMERKQTEAENITFPHSESPIRINVDCLSFNRKAQKQDGFNPSKNRQRDDSSMANQR